MLDLEPIVPISQSCKNCMILHYIFRFLCLGGDWWHSAPLRMLLKQSNQVQFNPATTLSVLWDTLHC